jgi:hypothetical protein
VLIEGGVNCKLDGILPSIVQTALTGVVEATATGYKRTSGSWISDGYAAGMSLHFAGFLSGSVNNGAHQITAITATDLTCAGTVVEVPPALQAITTVLQKVFIDSTATGTLQNWPTNNVPLTAINNAAPGTFTSVDVMWQNKVYVDADGHLVPRQAGTSALTGFNLGASASRFQRVYAYTLNGTELTVSGNASVNRLGVGSNAFPQWGIVLNPTLNPVSGSAVGVYVAANMTAVADNDILYGIYSGPTFSAGGKANVTAIGLQVPSVTGGATNYAIKTGTGLVSFGDIVMATASTTARASINLPHGAAPSSPVNGDVWTTTAGLFARINGVTVGPYT